MKGVTSVTVSVPLTIRRRGGRKQIIGPDGAVARQGGGGCWKRGGMRLSESLPSRKRWTGPMSGGC